MAETVAGQRPGKQWVRIVAGPHETFVGFIGALEAGEPEPGKVTVVVSLFGKPVRITLDREQVQKI